MGTFARGELFAIIAGLCAGLASVSGKFAFGESQNLEVFSFTTKLLPSAEVRVIKHNLLQL